MLRNVHTEYKTQLPICYLNMSAQLQSVAKDPRPRTVPHVVLVVLVCVDRQVLSSWLKI